MSDWGRRPLTTPTARARNDGFNDGRANRPPRQSFQTDETEQAYRGGYATGQRERKKDTG